MVYRNGLSVRNAPEPPFQPELGAVVAPEGREPAHGVGAAVSDGPAHSDARAIRQRVVRDRATHDCESIDAGGYSRMDSVSAACR